MKAKRAVGAKRYVIREAYVHVLGGVGLVEL